MKKILVALAGQPNCGKSTTFNALTGASQYIANYPGVTVEKKTGFYSYKESNVELVDLPGTYSLTSYSLEERVARDFLIQEKPSVVVNIADASNLKRNLYLTFQLLEMGIPVVVALNMMDVAHRRGIEIDVKALSSHLGTTTVPTAIKTGKGKDDLLKAIHSLSGTDASFKPLKIDYEHMEPFLEEIEGKFSGNAGFSAKYSLRWLSLKLMEGDSSVNELVEKNCPDAKSILEEVEKKRKDFEFLTNETPERHIAFRRYLVADKICKSCLIKKTARKKPFSDRVDEYVCNRFLGPAILFGVIYLLYYLSIVQGNKVTAYTWPLLSKLRSITEFLMPDPGFIQEPFIRSLSLWFVDSINAVLNYVPIFFILFALIAILEDTGYMPRMAFIMDRVFKRFGLHGQSTLPMVLGGVYVGGCAVPGVMATKGIPDERARIATILIIPMLNCLAKVPLYILLVNVYFAEHKGLAMFFISTVTIFMALPVAKLLTLTVLREKETAPFVMEMPPYHIPTIRGVLGRAVERVWLFIRKIITIVAAIAVILFVFLHFPGLNNERQAHYDALAENAKASFYEKIQENSYGRHIQEADLMELVLYWEKYKKDRMGVRDPKKAKSIDAAFIQTHPVFFKIIKPRKDKEARDVNLAFKKLLADRKKIIREIKTEKINNSYMGRFGRSLEPVTRWAGFNWRVNVALLSALAAKENSVATLGALYQQNEDGESLESRMKQEEKHFTPLHALALMLFMALYPPCIATAIMVKVQASTKWMLLGLIFPTLLGTIAAILIFTGGSLLGLSGLEAMVAFYAIVVIATVVTGLIKNKTDYVE